MLAVRLMVFRLILRCRVGSLRLWAMIPRLALMVSFVMRRYRLMLRLRMMFRHRMVRVMMHRCRLMLRLRVVFRHRLVRGMMRRCRQLMLRLRVVLRRSCHGST